MFDLLVRGSEEQTCWMRIAAFLSHKAPTTQRSYSAIIRGWSKFIGAEPGTWRGHERFIAANSLHASAYIQWLKEQPGEAPRHARTSVSRAVGKLSKRVYDAENRLSGSTINVRFSCMRRVYLSLVNAGMIGRNPFDSDEIQLPSGKILKRPTELIDYSKVREILAYPDPTTRKGLRDRAILALLFGGGLRRGEISPIRFADVKQSAHGTWYVRLRATKGRKDSDQALPGWALDPLFAWVNHRRAEGALDGDWVFTGGRGRTSKATTERCHAETIYRLFHRACAAAGIVGTPHCARATAITRLLDTGLSHRDVKNFSRHASVQMVEVYDKRRYTIEENPGRFLEFSTCTASRPQPSGSVPVVAASVPAEEEEAF